MKQLSCRNHGISVISALLMACVFSAFVFYGCTKSSSGSTTSYATPFIGTWNNTSSTCGTVSGTTTFSAGSNGNTFTMNGTIGGSASCLKTITLSCVASSNTSFTMPAVTFTDNCGLSYTFSGSGTLNNNVITVNQIITGAVNANCTATLTK